MVLVPSGGCIKLGHQPAEPRTWAELGGVHRALQLWMCVAARSGSSIGIWNHLGVDQKHATGLGGASLTILGIPNV